MGRPQSPWHISKAESRRLRAVLRNAEVSQQSLADELGVSKQAVNRVLAGQTSSQRIAELIRNVVRGWEAPPESQREDAEAQS